MQLTLDTIRRAAEILDSNQTARPYTVVLSPDIERSFAGRAAGCVVGPWPRRSGMRGRKRALSGLLWTRRLPRRLYGVNLEIV